MSHNPYAPPLADLEDIGGPRIILGNLERKDFGGFWLRVLATVIDCAIMFPCQAVVGYAFVHLAILIALTPTQARVLDITISLVIPAVYTIGLWVSPWRATIGKRLCGLVVVSDHLDRLSLARATARYLATILSALLIVGVFTIPASGKRRALHDMLARTLVVKRRRLERVVAAAEGSR